MRCEWTLTRNVVFSVSIWTAWTRDGPLVAEIVVITGTLSILTWHVYPEEGYLLLDPDEELTEDRKKKKDEFIQQIKNNLLKHLPEKGK